MAAKPKNATTRVIKPTPTGTDLVIHYTARAVELLKNAKTATEAKHVRDLAQAALRFAKAQELGEEAEKYARGIVNAAHLRMGEFLKKTDKNKGARLSGGTNVVPPGMKDLTVPTLADQGITKRDSATAQRLAEAVEKCPEVLKPLLAGETTVLQAVRACVSTIENPGGRRIVKRLR